jgi:hypothetical protein
MFSGDLSKRATAADARELCAWARQAKAGDRCVYHIGNLVADRSAFPALHQLAETVLLLQETGWLVGAQQRIRLPTVDGWSYACVRTGSGRAPRAVLAGTITATHYRAMEAIRARAAAVSVTRAVRDALSVSDDTAAELVSTMRRKGWVIEQPVKGWELSPAGTKLLVA